MMKALKTALAALALTSAGSTAQAQDNLPRTPQEAHAQWNQATNEKNAEWLCALYTDDAVMQRADGSAAKGKEQVCADLKTLISITKSVDLKTDFVLQGDNIAILRSIYTIIIKSEDSTEQEVQNSGIEVVQKQKDGTWLFIADHPTGGK